VLSFVLRLTGLDAVAVDPDLVVQSPRKDHVAVGAEAATVTGSVRPFPLARDASVDEPLARGLRQT
jgi:hypothetical protein